VATTEAGSDRICIGAFKRRGFGLAKNRGSNDYRNVWAKYLTTGIGAQPLHIADESSSGITKGMAISGDHAKQAGFLIASEQFATGVLREVDDPAVYPPIGQHPHDAGSGQPGHPQTDDSGQYVRLGTGTENAGSR
jgi:hypothetical protein